MRGGARPGSGRKKGTVNKASEVRQEMLARATADGMSPLEYLLSVMRSSNDESKRLDAAKAAAPYVHPRLAAIEHKGDKENPLAFAILSAVPRLGDDNEGINGHSNGHAQAN